MKKNTVFITRKILEDGPKLLKSREINIEIFPHDYPIDRANLYEGAKNADALICMLTDQIDRSFLMANPHLKVISNYAVGFNNIDISVARELQIPIGNTPDVLTNATAELALGLMLATSRQFFRASESIRNGEWKDWNPTAFLGPELTGKTLGIIGMGRIGRRLSEMAETAFKMIILDSKKFSIQKILEQSDLISLHVPLNEKTKNMISRREFQLMKPNAILINTSRGEVINQDELIWALENKIIWGAGLDVTTPEPLPKNSKLLILDNVFITPHIGSASNEARKQMSLIAAQNIICGLEGKPLKAQVH